MNTGLNEGDKGMVRTEGGLGECLGVVWRNQSRGRGGRREKGRYVFSEFLTPEKAAISAEEQVKWGALTLHHFRPFC